MGLFHCFATDSPTPGKYLMNKMKKLLYLTAAAMLMASCNEDFDDWASPQTNEQGEQLTVIASSNIESLEFDLNEVEEDSLQVVDLSYQTADGYQVSYPLNKYVAKIAISEQEISEEEEATPSVSYFDIPVSNTGKIAKADLQSIITGYFGKRPEVRTVDLNVLAKLFTSPQQDVVINTNTVTIPMNVTPEAAPISSAYYLVGDMLSWDADGMMKFSHSDADVYDDPVFTILIETTADNQYWKIIPQDNIDNDDFWANPGVVGPTVDGDTSFEGNLVNLNAQAGKFERQGKYRMTINMVDYTYSIEEVLFDDYVYFIGATDGWANADQKLALVNNDGLYTGFVYCADPNGWGNQFKFQRVQGSWDNEINSATFASISGDFGYVDGNTNIDAAAGEGVYYVELNLGSLSLNATKVNTMGIIGDFNGWGGDVEMTWNAEDFCYEVTGAGATSAGWKFRVNNDWAINLGGVQDNLVANGDNLYVDASSVKLYPTRKNNDNIYCVVE